MIVKENIGYSFAESLSIVSGLYSNTNVSVRYLLVSKSFYAFKCCAELENIKEARKNARNLLRTLYTKFICTHLS